jgi:hypothetical protein
MEIVEPVIHQDMKEKLEEVLDGVKDVVIIPQLFKSMTYTYVDVVLER